MKESVSYLEIFNLFESFDFLTYEGRMPQGHFNVLEGPYIIQLLYAGGGKKMEGATLTGLRLRRRVGKEGIIWQYVEFDELLAALPEESQTQLLFHLDLFRRFL